MPTRPWKSWQNILVSTQIGSRSWVFLRGHLLPSSQATSVFESCMVLRMEVISPPTSAYILRATLLIVTTTKPLVHRSVCFTVSLTIGSPSAPVVHTPIDYGTLVS